MMLISKKIFSIYLAVLFSVGASLACADNTENCRKATASGIQLVKNFLVQYDASLFDNISPKVFKNPTFSDADAKIAEGKSYPWNFFTTPAAQLWIPFSDRLGKYEKELFSNYNNYLRSAYFLLDAAKNKAFEKYKTTDAKYRDPRVYFQGINLDDLGVDAFRHAYGTALLVRHMGLDAALCVMGAHEAHKKIVDSDFNFSIMPWTVRVSSTMDFYNNFVGATVGLKYPEANDETLVKAIEEKLNSGNLLIVEGTSEENEFTIPYEFDVYYPSDCINDRSQKHCRDFARDAVNAIEVETFRRTQALGRYEPRVGGK